MENIIAEVKTRNDIVDVIGSYITLRKAGKHFSAICPFHQEKSPSFVVSPERQMWYCFGACHEGGDVINFIMKYENLSFYEALQELAIRANIQMENVKFQDREWEKREVLYKINKIACEFFQHILHNTRFGERAREYIQKRGLNEKIVKTFQIGYAPDSWESLLGFLKKKKFSEQDIERTGLLVKGNRGFYDRFRGRLMFPIKDSRDNIIGFSGRILTGEKEAKYINIPETEIYHKRESLYGIHITKDEIRRSGHVLVVEGEFDVIGPYQYGVNNIVAIKGSSVTRDHLRILKRYATKIILCLDSDAAGQDAVMRTIKEAEEMDIEIYVMELPEGKDPDEAVRNNLHGFKESLKNLTTAYDFILKAIRKKYDIASPFEKKRAVDELVPFLHFIKNPILLAHYTRQSSEMFDVTEESLREVLSLYVRKQQTAGLRKKVPEVKPEQIPMVEMKQKYILSSILQQENPFTQLLIVFEYIKPEDFTNPTLEKIAHALLTYQKNHEHFNVKDFIQFLPAELHITFDELYLHTHANDPHIKDDFKTIALKMKIDVTKAEIKRLSSLNDSGEYDETLKNLTLECSRLQRLLDVKTGKR